MIKKYKQEQRSETKLQTTEIQCEAKSTELNRDFENSFFLWSLAQTHTHTVSLAARDAAKGRGGDRLRLGVVRAAWCGAAVPCCDAAAEVYVIVARLHAA